METKREPTPGGTCSSCLVKAEEEGGTKRLLRASPWGSVVLTCSSLASQAAVPSAPVLTGEFPKQRTPQLWKPDLEIRGWEMAVEKGAMGSFQGTAGGDESRCPGGTSLPTTAPVGREVQEGHGF